MEILLPFCWICWLLYLLTARAWGNPESVMVQGWSIADLGPEDILDSPELGRNGCLDSRHPDIPDAILSIFFAEGKGGLWVYRGGILKVFRFFSSVGYIYLKGDWRATPRHPWPDLAAGEPLVSYF